MFSIKSIARQAILCVIFLLVDPVTLLYALLIGSLLGASVFFFHFVAIAIRQLRRK